MLYLLFINLSAHRAKKEKAAAALILSNPSSASTTIDNSGTLGRKKRGALTLDQLVTGNFERFTL